MARIRHVGDPISSSVYLGRSSSRQTGRRTRPGVKQSTQHDRLGVLMGRQGKVTVEESP